MVDFTGIREANGYSIVPASALDVERMDKIKPGKPGQVSFVFSRSIDHQRWYRGLVAIVAEGCGIHPDTLHADLKLKAGLVRRILMSQAGPVIELKSTSFRQMDQIEFSEYTAIADRIIFRDYLGPDTRRSVYREVERLVGIARPE